MPPTKFADVEHLRLQRLLTREGEQALCQRGRAFGAAHGIAGKPCQPCTIGVLCLCNTLQRLQVADDDGQEVVEVVGNPAGQMADAFHLLCVQEVLRRFLQGERRSAGAR